jgi:hypothetical protein
MRAQEFNEVRLQGNPDVKYEDEKTKVIAILSSFNSAKYTKLAQNVARVTMLTEEIDKLKEEIKQSTRDDIAELFDASDAAKTRVVDTVSFILTLSKDPAESKPVEYAKVLEELTTHLTPELITVLASIKEKFTGKPRKSTPKLSVDAKLDLKESLTMRHLYHKFLNLIKEWGRNYDYKLELLKNMVA